MPGGVAGHAADSGARVALSNSATEPSTVLTATARPSGCMAADG